MSKKRRFYQLNYTNTGDPMFFEDMGNTLKMSGVLLEGMGSQVLLVSPSGTMPQAWDSIEEEEGDLPVYSLVIIQPTLEEWSELLRQTDDPIYFTEDETGAKHVHRKQRMAISGAVQQQIWVRDNLTCVFCLRKMGEGGVSLTVDHFVPLELDGVNSQLNYISCCRRCNKDKGSMPAHKYCEMVGVNHSDIFNYMAGGCRMDEIRYWDTPDSIRKKSK